MMLYWGIFTVGFYLGIIFNLVLWSRKDELEDQAVRKLSGSEKSVDQKAREVRVSDALIH